MARPDNIRHETAIRGAHGQPEQLVVVILADDTVLFHDRPRMIYGMCCDAQYEPLFIHADAFPPEQLAEAVEYVRRCYLAPEYKPEGGLAEGSVRYKHDRRAGEL